CGWGTTRTRGGTAIRQLTQKICDRPPEVVLRALLCAVKGARQRGVIAMDSGAARARARRSGLSDGDERGDVAGRLPVVRLGANDGPDDCGHLIDAIGPRVGDRAVMVVFPSVRGTAGAAMTGDRHRRAEAGGARADRPL